MYPKETLVYVLRIVAYSLLLCPTIRSASCLIHAASRLDSLWLRCATYLLQHHMLPDKATTQTQKTERPMQSLSYQAQ